MSVSIRIGKDTKSKLDILRKDKHIGVFVESMINYFIYTKADPKDINEAPIVHLLKRVEVAITTIKGIDKNRLAPIQYLIENGLGFTANNMPVKDNISNDISTEEVESLVNLNSSLDKQLEAANSKVKHLEIQLTTKSTDAKIADLGEKQAVVASIAKSLGDIKKSVKFNTAVYEVNKNEYDALIERLKEI